FVLRRSKKDASHRLARTKARCWSASRRPRVYCGTAAHSAAQAAGFSHIACHDHRTPWVEVWRPRARGKDAGCLGHVARRRKVLPCTFERRPLTHSLILKTP